MTAVALRGISLAIVTFLASWFVLWKGVVWIMSLGEEGSDLWKFTSLFFAFAAATFTLVAHFNEESE